MFADVGLKFFFADEGLVTHEADQYVVSVCVIPEMNVKLMRCWKVHPTQNTSVCLKLIVEVSKSVI